MWSSILETWSPVLAPTSYKHLYLWNDHHTKGAWWWYLGNTFQNCSIIYLHYHICVNGTVVPRSIWALNPDSTTLPIGPISFYPKPQFKSTWTTGPSFATWSLLDKLFPSNKERMTFKYTIPCIPSSALGSIAAEHIYWSRSQFQGHSHHIPLPPNHPFTINDIGPPIALAMEVIIVFPLISSYKYEKLEEEKGC